MNSSVTAGSLCSQYQRDAGVQGGPAAGAGEMRGPAGPSAQGWRDAGSRRVLLLGPEGCGVQGCPATRGWRDAVPGGGSAAWDWRDVGSGVSHYLRLEGCRGQRRSRCPGPEGYGVRGGPAARGRRDAGSEGVPLPEALAAGAAVSRDCPLLENAFSPRVSPPRLSPDEVIKHLVLIAAMFHVSFPSLLPLAREHAARCQKSSRWYLSPAVPLHLFWGIINPFGMPAFSRQGSPSTISAELSLPVRCQLGDGRQTLSLMSHTQHALCILKEKGRLSSAFPGILFGVDPRIFQRLDLKAQSCCSKAGPQPCWGVSHPPKEVSHPHRKMQL